MSFATLLKSKQLVFDRTERVFTPEPVKGEAVRYFWDQLGLALYYENFGGTKYNNKHRHVRTLKFVPDTLSVSKAARKRLVRLAQRCFPEASVFWRERNRRRRETLALFIKIPQ